MSTHKVPDGTELYDIKRFYLPGITVTRKCPHCNAIMTWDGSEEYLCSPNVGKFHFHFYCQACDEESYFDANLSINIEIAELSLSDKRI